MSSVHPSSANEFQEALSSHLGADFSVKEAKQNAAGGIALSVSLGGKTYTVNLDSTIVAGFSTDKQTWAKQIANGLQLVHANEGKKADFNLTEKTVSWENGPKTNYDEPVKLKEALAKFLEKLESLEQASQYIGEQITTLQHEIQLAGASVDPEKTKQLKEQTEIKETLDGLIKDTKAEELPTKVALQFSLLGSALNARLPPSIKLNPVPSPIF